MKSYFDESKLEEQLIKDMELSDDRYGCYHLKTPVQIFKCVIDEEDAGECDIYVSTKHSLIEILPLLNEYLEWFKNCGEELTGYFRDKSGEILPDNWFESIEVYSFSVAFDGLNDYGATIVCGESVFEDHSFEFDFELFQVFDDRMIG